jgi:hypothetical protein
VVGAGDTTVVDVGNGGAADAVVMLVAVVSMLIAGTASPVVWVPPPGVEDGGRAGDDTLEGNGVTCDGVRGAVMIGAGSGGSARDDPPAPDTTSNPSATADTPAAAPAIT